MASTILGKIDAATLRNKMSSTKKANKQTQNEYLIFWCIEYLKGINHYKM